MTLIEDVARIKELRKKQKTAKIKESKDRLDETIDAAIRELETGPCKTFSTIDELFDDLETTVPQCWQITDERKVALDVILKYISYDAHDDIEVCDHAAVLHAMLEEANNVPR